jgi:dolichyl-phosphate-mannose-protein mannosyltransferase
MTICCDPESMTDSAVAEPLTRPTWRPVIRSAAQVWWGWIGPLVVTIFGAFLRFDRLSVPHSVVFDETYYVPDAYGILRHGVEISHVHDAGVLLAHGGTRILLGTQGEYVAHPPLGKIMISVGEWLFGLTPFGWRFAVALIGSVAILLTARIARRMTSSTWIGCVAGLLMALDGLEFVLSRTAILDIFLMFWILAAFGLLVIDRDRCRARLLRALDQSGPATASRLRLGVRWPLIAAGLCLGCACATKWDGVWYLPAFAGLVIAWDLTARPPRPADPLASRIKAVGRSDGPWLPLWFGLAPLAAYVASWTGWFATSYGYDRTGAALNGGRPTSTILAWLQYQKSMLGFGLGLHTYQTYQSNPLGWLLLTRPTSFYANCVPAGSLCGSARSTEQEVLAIGTPLIWWAAAVALAGCLVWWIRQRDWRPGAIIVGVAAGWLPWIWFYVHDHRTEFYYYAVVFEPFLVIGLALCLGQVTARAWFGWRRLSIVACAGYLIAVLANFLYLYPVLAARALPFSSWASRMWFHGWI